MLRMPSMPCMRVRTHARCCAWQHQQFASANFYGALGKGLSGAQLSLPRVLAVEVLIKRALDSDLTDSRFNALARQHVGALR